MKKQLITLIVFFGLALSAHAGTANKETVIAKDTVKTVTFTVYGNCGMCKRRIEHAAKITGVKSADWNQKTKILTVKYDAGKVSEKAIQEAIAASGHDTEKATASDKSYNNLMGCCQYKRK